MKLKIPGAEGEINEEDYNFLQKISSSDFVGLIGGDWIKEWQWNNLLKISKRVREKCEMHGYDPQQVAPKFLTQFFEASSLEEDDTLQNMWANLLLNKSLNTTTNIHYVSILKSLEPFEAQLLNGLFAESKGNHEIIFDFDLVVKNFSIPKTQLAVLVQKLYSFNILRPPINRGATLGEYPIALETIKIFRFSEMGIDFCDTCTNVSLPSTPNLKYQSS